MAGPGLAAQDLPVASGSSRCRNVVVALWADPVANRLEGFTIFLACQVFLGLVRDGMTFAIGVEEQPSPAGWMTRPGRPAANWAPGPVGAIR